MNLEPHRLTGDEIQALKFAAHRQLARWANKRELPPRHRARRAALVRAVRTLEASEVPPHWAVNLCVDDVDATAETALAFGATIVLPPMDTPWSRSAVIADPQGGVIAVSAPSAP